MRKCGCRAAESTLGAGTPTGNVTVTDGVNTCTGTVSAGKCQLTFTSAGSPTLRATYEGDADFNGSYGETAHEISSSLDVTIEYGYDKLYRLTSANYSTGDAFGYDYDEFGNRLHQDVALDGQQPPTTTTYTYDDANRLITAGGVTQTWDANGNLLNDGVNTYTYDAANRLQSFTGPSVGGTATYGYSGLGDRLQQTVNGQTTNYTLDINAGLTQVLDDGSDTYYYGLERISQAQGSQYSYFLADALGSVRQLTDASGAVSLAQSYDPYGVILASIGSSGASYGFTGELTDNYSKTIYLRARMYAPATGRFLTKDAWEGDDERPSSYNSWVYVYGNPTNLSDPSGHDPWWCEYNSNPQLCFAEWTVTHGGRLTASILKAIYLSHPDETLILLQRQFNIHTPTGYQFHLASADSTALYGGKKRGLGTVLGAKMWFAELNGVPGSLFEYSEYACLTTTWTTSRVS